MRTRKVNRKKIKKFSMSGGSSVTRGLNLYPSSNAFRALQEFYADSTNPLLSSSRSTKKSRNAVTKHRKRILDLLAKNKTPSRK